VHGCKRRDASDIVHPGAGGGGDGSLARQGASTSPNPFTMQVLVGHPLDTVKVRIQTMEVVPGKPPPYTGMVDCAKQIVAKEGVSLLLSSAFVVVRKARPSASRAPGVSQTLDRALPEPCAASQ
jgi:hypothetical protein